MEVPVLVLKPIVVWGIPGFKKTQYTSIYISIYIYQLHSFALSHRSPPTPRLPEKPQKVKMLQRVDAEIHQKKRW